VDAHLSRLGMTTEKREGIRVTPPEQVAEIAGVLAGRMNKGVVAALNEEGVCAVGLCLGDGRAFRTVKTSRFAFDVGRVGDVVECDGWDAGLIVHLLRGKYLPVLCSIGLEGGGFLNVNADDAAAAVARGLRASSLVLLTDVPGILDAERRVIPEITRHGIEGLIASGVISGGMVVKARAAASTAHQSGVTVQIMSGSDEAALEAWGAGKGSGTRVLPDASGRGE
jgi:acetylglutamate kinase